MTFDTHSLVKGAIVHRLGDDNASKLTQKIGRVLDFNVHGQPIVEWLDTEKILTEIASELIVIGNVFFKKEA